MEAPNSFTTMEVNSKSSLESSKSPPNDLNIINHLYKTKICPRLASKNECRYGENCPFAHCTTELRPLPDFRKTKLCSNFMEKNWCPAGKSCSFAHGEIELRCCTKSTLSSECTIHMPYIDCDDSLLKSIPENAMNNSDPKKQKKVDELFDFIKLCCSCFMEDQFSNASTKDKNSVLKILKSYKNNCSDPYEDAAIGTSDTLESEASTKSKKTRRGKRGGKNRNKDKKEQVQNVNQTHLIPPPATNKQEIANIMTNLMKHPFVFNKSNQSMPMQPQDLWNYNNCLNHNLNGESNSMFTNYPSQPLKDCEINLSQSLDLDPMGSSFLGFKNEHSMIPSFPESLPSKQYSNVCNSKYQNTQNSSLWDETFLKVHNKDFFPPEFFEQRSHIGSLKSTRDGEGNDDTSFSALSSELLLESELDDKTSCAVNHNNQVLHENDVGLNSLDYPLRLPYQRTPLDTTFFLNNLNGSFTETPLEQKIPSFPGNTDYQLYRDLINLNIDTNQEYI